MAANQLKKRKLPDEDDCSGNNPGKRSKNDIDSSVLWKPENVISTKFREPESAVSNVIKLLDQDCTIPFIARYRKEQTNNMGADILRKVQEELSRLRNVAKKVESVVKAVAKEGVLDLDTSLSLRSATTLVEVEQLYAPLKTASKRTLAERAKEAGLEEAANKILKGSATVELASLVDGSVKGRTCLTDVTNGVQHIIADRVSKNPETVKFVRQLRQETSYICLKSAKSRSAEKPKAKKEDEKGKSPASKKDELFKFETYFDFKATIGSVKPYQVLAINRGEKLKYLSVQIIVPDWVQRKFTSFCETEFRNNHFSDKMRTALLKDSFTDAYNRLILPSLQRQVRSELTREAEKASIEVFAQNLKKKLMSPALRGSSVLAIDPGYAKGCKVAVLDTKGRVEHTVVIFIQGLKRNDAASTLKHLIQDYQIEHICIGNGTACRETEVLVSEVLNQSFGSLKPAYTIVDEQGASIYSCSPLAKKEFPTLDPNLISAVSLGRRLQDPLSELVKVDAQHLGVGMYQHDISQSALKTTLESVVSECVSFVGVDINTVSEVMLQKIAGLTSARASSIIKWRDSHDGFVCRAQIQRIKGIGPKTYEQMAGFVRILPQTLLQKTPKKPTPLKGKKIKYNQDNFNDPNPLDRTWIHPESYDVAKRFIDLVGADWDDILYEPMIRAVNEFMRGTTVEDVAKKLSVGAPTMTTIIEGLKQDLEYDFRGNFQSDIFKKSVTTLDQLKIGAVLTGVVRNVTHFGAFVDIGVGNDGLVHISKMNGKVLSLGNRVEVRVASLELARKRIGLWLMNILGEN